MEGREREDPKFRLNQGPSEPCYAAAAVESSSGVMVVGHFICLDKGLV